MVGIKGKTKKVQEDFKPKKELLFFLVIGLFIGHPILIIVGMCASYILLCYFVPYKIGTYIGGILR